MNLLIDCPHCHAEVSVPANMEVGCPQCRQPVFAVDQSSLNKRRNRLTSLLHFRGGPGLYTAILLVSIPFLLLGVWFAVPALPSMPGLDHLFAGGPLLLLLIMLYFLPALIASSRRASNSSQIFLLNLLTGLTIIGWVAAFIWAAVDKPTQA